MKSTTITRITDRIGAYLVELRLSKGYSYIGPVAAIDLRETLRWMIEALGPEPDFLEKR